MKTILAISALAVMIYILLLQLATSCQMDDIEDKIDRMYNKDCLYCSRRGIVDSMDT